MKFMPGEKAPTVEPKWDEVNTSRVQKKNYKSIFTFTFNKDVTSVLGGLLK